MERPDPEPVLSKHTIIYDEALFKVLDEIILKYKMKPFCRLGFPTNSKPSFNDIWEFINNNINNLNHSRKVIATRDTKPNNFAVVMALICNYRNLSSWEEVMNENYEVDLGNNAIDKYNCACNHYIYNVYVMTNPHTHMKVVVGSTCVNKYMETNKAVIDKIAILEKQIRTEKRKADKAKKIAKLIEEQNVNELYVGMLKAIKAGAKNGFLRHPINEYKSQLEDMVKKL